MCSQIIKYVMWLASLRISETLQVNVLHNCIVLSSQTDYLKHKVWLSLRIPCENPEFVLSVIIIRAHRMPVPYSDWSVCVCFHPVRKFLFLNALMCYIHQLATSTVHLDIIYYYHVLVYVLDLHFVYFHLIPSLATRTFRDWLSPASKSRYGWMVISCFQVAIWLKYRWSNVNPKYNTISTFSRFSDHGLEEIIKFILQYVGLLYDQAYIDCTSWYDLHISWWFVPFA